MPHDVFISHANKDRRVAIAACAMLEEHRFRCWIAPRDVMPGTEYAEAIINGIEGCQIFVIIFSAEANNSPAVRREVERAVTKGKVILPFRVDEGIPSKAMEYCLSNTHWLDALTPPLEAHLARLTDTVSRLLGNEISHPDVPSSARPKLETGQSESAFEYRSEWELFGVPLVHIAFGLPLLNGRKPSARGYVAIGDSPRGLIAIGSFAIGGIALGAFPVGLFSIGFLPIGVFSAGAVALGLIGSYGVFAIAPAAFGWLAVGYHGGGVNVFAAQVWSHDVLPPWVHVFLLSLCFLSYLLPRFVRLLGRMAQPPGIRS